MEGNIDDEAYGQYKSQAEEFMCNCLQQGKNNVQQSPGGLLWFLSYNLQYVTTAAFVAAAYSEYLTTNLATFDCPGDTIKSNDLLLLAKSQV